MNSSTGVTTTPKVESEVENPFRLEDFRSDFWQRLLTKRVTDRFHYCAGSRIHDVDPFHGWALYGYVA